MQVVICDKCGRRCDSDVYRIALGKNNKGPQDGADLCAVCIFPLADLLPQGLRHLLPSKDRAELVAKTATTEAPPK